MSDQEDIYVGPRFDKIAVTSALIMFAAVQIIAAQRIGFAFEYPLDDVYIHLAMASEIAKGGYGVNYGEYASAASSALYPVLLAPFADSGFQRFLPVLWNIVGLTLTAWMWGRALMWAGHRSISGWALAVGAPLLVGAVSTAYVGMEHTLHAAASLAIIFGLARFVNEGRLNAMLFVGLLFSPLFRFEGLALCTLALVVLAIRGRPFAAVFGAILTFVPIGIFVYYLISLGLDPLPNSVQAKLVSSEDADVSLPFRIMGTVGINLAKFGGLAISLLAATLLFVTCLTSTNQSRVATWSGFVMAVVGVSALTFISFDIDVYDGYVGPAAALMIVGMILLVMQLFRGLKEDDANVGWIWFALAVGGGAMAHVALGQTGWMERYEHYAIAGLALGLIIVSGWAQQARRVSIALAIVAIACSGARYAYKTSTQYHWGSRAIHLQQYQMQRYAKEFLNRNVAVNDLGWVVWANPNYVLDLYGLANHEARRLRIFAPTQGWGGPLVTRNDVSVIMIYKDFVGEAIAPEWVPLGKLVLRNARGYLGGAEVEFFAANHAEVPHAKAALLEWKPTLLPDTCFVREGEDKCWN